MKFVGAGADSGVDGRAVAAVVGGISVGENLKFGDAVDAEGGADKVGAGAVAPHASGVGAVDEEEFTLGAAAGDRKSLRGAEAEGNEAGGAFGVFLGNGLDAGSEQRQLDVVATVEGQFMNLLFADEEANGAGGGVYGGSGGGDFHGLGDISNGESELFDSILADGEFDGAACAGLEAVALGFDAVISDGQAGDGIDALGVGGGDAGDAGLNVGDDNFGVGHPCALTIGDDAGNGGGGGLRTKR